MELTGGAVLLALWVGCQGEAAPEGLREIVLESSGLQRTAYVRVPEHPPGKDLPLVLLFHGGQGETGHDGRSMVARWRDVQDNDVVFAFPNGIGTGERAWAGPDDERDLRFVDDLVAKLDLEVGIDLSRVYAAGFSNGSGFVWMLECSRADRFAGFAHVQQSMAEPVLARCAPTAHVPSLSIHGDADPKARWEGNAQTVGIPRTFEFLLKHHGCDPAAAREQVLPGMTRTTYSTCLKVSAVELLRISGGGHRWPPEAGAEILRFWRKHAML
jgi:polyhydroxybutyrate depolymerase